MNSDLLGIHALMRELGNDRPIFHSEADFQHALAWLIQRRHPDARIRLETRPERGVRLDILVGLPSGNVALELKYLVGRTSAVVDSERFELPNQAAQLISRYDVIKDVVRLERFVEDGVASVGYAIVLSNDQGYWREGRKPDPVDVMFRISEGRSLSGVLSWAATAGAGTMRKRVEPLSLSGVYNCRWLDYSRVQTLEGRPKDFKYVVFAVAAQDASTSNNGQTN